MIDAATFSTKGALGELEFEKNHLGENDVALFDFSTMYMSENASRIVERKGKRLLLCVAGDSLVEVRGMEGREMGREGRRGRDSLRGEGEGGKGEGERVCVWGGGKRQPSRGEGEGGE